MDFLSPWSFLLFLPLGGIVVLLYLLKLKRREQVVSSVLLWQDAVADIQANAPFQKLKKSLLLLLQLLALLALITAVARPYVRTRGTNENRIVVILDASASMQATDVSPSRFENARSRALDIVRRMGAGDTVLLVTAGAKPRVVASFTSDKRALYRAIRSLKAVDTSCNMRQALVLSLSLVAGRSAVPPRIVVISDGGFGPLSDLSAGNAKLDFLRVGKQCDNVAITGLASRKTLSGQQQVFIGLRNYSRRERKFNLELYLDDKLVDVREETLPAGKARQEILDDTSNLAGRVTAKLDVTDDLATDNVGYVYLSKPRKISVLLVTAGNVFLENALNLDPRSEIIKADAVPADMPAGKYDLVVFDDITPPKSLPKGAYMLINTSATQGPAEVGGKLTRPTIVDFARNHPVSAYVDFGSVRIAESRVLKPKFWASRILEAEGGVLGVAGSKDGRTFVQLSFSLLESDFPLRVGFPIFVANCLDWIAPSNGKTGAGQTIRAGQPIYLDVPADTTELIVESPDGREQAIGVARTPVAFENTDLVGIYKVRTKKLTREFACNLCSSDESNTLPNDTLTVGGRSFTASGKAVRTNREYHGMLVFLALGLLVFEWYAYHRRL